MRLAPVHDLAELVPVVDVLKRHVLHGGAGHNEAVIELAAEGVESVVELNQVVGAHVGGLVAGDAHEVAAHLQRGLGDEAQDLGLGLHLGGHEVQDGHAKRADLLGLGDLLLQGKDALLVQDLLGGESVGDVDGHGARYLSGALGAADETAWPPDAPVGPPPALELQPSQYSGDMAPGGTSGEKNVRQQALLACRSCGFAQYLQA